jgi:hypothetical protein
MAGAIFRGSAAGCAQTRLPATRVARRHAAAPRILDLIANLHILKGYPITPGGGKGARRPPGVRCL